MNKYEFELKKLAIHAERFGIGMNLLQHVFTLSAVVGSIYLIMQGLGDMVESNPETLRALAVVIEKLNINTIIAYVVAGGTSIGFVYERVGKKRAIRKLKDLRADVEGNDPYKPSSNLDENGHTPKARAPK